MRASRYMLPAILLATVFPVEFASAAGVLLAHRAVYDLDLGQATEKSGVVGISGRIVYEFNGSACEGYSTKHRFVTHMNMRETQSVNDYQTTTYEKGDGKAFEFASKFFVDQELDKETKGTAQLDGEQVDVSLQKPKVRKLELPMGQFPTQHTLELIDKAKAGEHFYETTMFDGSDTADTVMTTTVIIGNKTAPKPADPEVAALKGLGAESYWPVSIAYFDPSKAQGEETPEYAISFKLYENGVNRDIEMSYGEFSIKAKLVELDVLDSKPDCEGQGGQPSKSHLSD